MSHNIIYMYCPEHGEYTPISDDEIDCPVCFDLEWAEYKQERKFYEQDL